MADLSAILVLRNPVPCVSRNLVLAIQYPKVIPTNLAKKINLGGECNLLMILPFLTSNATLWVWFPRNIPWDGIPSTISHILMATVCIPKDPYSLQYVWVDNAICIIKSLGLCSFMAKTDLKPAFRLIPVHPGNWHLLGIYWQSQYYMDLYLPLGLCSAL